MLVSILIPCFNSARWVGQAIESALAQHYPAKEVVVVDDGSTDGSLEVIRSFGDRIRWETGPNRGGNAARNRLLSLAQGEWLQYLDADDYLLPEKISRQVDFLADHAGTDVLYGLVTKEDWSEAGVQHVLQRIPEPRDPWILLARWYLPQTGGPLWRKSAIEDVGAWRVDQPCCQEHELYFRLLEAGKQFTFCPYNGAIYRIWSPETVSLRNQRETRRRRLEILDRIELHLRDRGQLSPARLDALGQSRFQVARLTWPVDSEEAAGIVDRLLRSDPAFRPKGNQPGGHHPPLPYRMLWRGLGFRRTEQVGDRVRRIKRGLAEVLK